MLTEVTEVTAAPSGVGSAACAEVFSTLSAEPAASDSAPPNTATAAAPIVSFFACATSQSRSRVGESGFGSGRGLSITWVTVSAWPTAAATTVPAAGAAGFFVSDTRHGRSVGDSAGCDKAVSP